MTQGHLHALTVRERMIDEAVRRTVHPLKLRWLAHHVSLECGEACNESIDNHLLAIRAEFRRLSEGA